MKRYLILACLAVASILGSQPSFAGPLIAPTRSIAAPKGFAGACGQYAWLCVNKAGRSMPDSVAMSLLKSVNRSVNARVRPVADRGNSDRWSLPTNNRGDCEDYALAKKKQLIEAGFPANRLAMTVVLDRRGNNHAVLMARLNGGDYVLDNLSGSVKSWQSTGYTFLARQSFENKKVWKVILAGPRAKQFAQR